MTHSLQGLLKELASVVPAWALPLQKGVVPKEIRGFFTDVDGVCNDLEAAQEDTWIKATLDLLRFSHPDRELPPELVALVKNHIKEVFHTGDFSRLVSGISDYLREFGYLPESISSNQELDDQITLRRGAKLLSYAEEHRSDVFAEHHRAHLDAMEFLSERNVLLGMYTNTPKELAKPLLYFGYGRDRLARLFPSELRLYGCDTVRLGIRRKHYADGWIELAKRAGLRREDVVIADDRPNVCLHAHLAGFKAICITGHRTSSIASAIKELNGARRDIWTVTCLTELANTLRARKEIRLVG